MDTKKIDLVVSIYGTSHSNMNHLRIILTHYKSFVVASNIITLSCISTLYTNGPSVLSAMFLFKIITSGLIIIFINIYKKNEFYYYQNLGFTKRAIWFYTIGIDFILFVLLMGLILFIK